MYRPKLNTSDKGGAIAGVIAIHAGLAFAFLHLSGTVDLTDPQSALRVINLAEVKPPPPPEPPPPPPERQVQTEKPKEKEGGSSPKNLKSEATPVVAPKPRIVIPVPPKIAVAEKPREGAAPTQGASDVQGPGTGAGGTGTGTGSGAGGSGTGGGGSGGKLASRSRLSTPVLTGRNFSRDLLRAWPRGADVFTRLRVDANGYVIQCIVDRGTGNPAIDNEVCERIRTYLRFEPAVDESGQRVADWAGYRQAAPR
jgi:protein TonB